MDTTTPARARKSPAEIIRDFGGPTRLSRLLGGISQAAVSNWATRGFIPDAWHLRILLLAEREGVSLSASDLLAVESGEAA